METGAGAAVRLKVPAPVTELIVTTEVWATTEAEVAITKDPMLTVLLVVSHTEG